jgi:hypothetical protein
MEELPVFSPLVNPPEDTVRDQEGKGEAKKMEYRELGKHSPLH